MKQATVLIVCCFFLFGAVVLDNSGAHGSGFSTGVEIEMTAGEGSGGAAGAGTAGGNERSAAEMFWVILGVFLGGIALNLTPCIYPLIPVTISYFGGKSLSEQGRTGTSPIAAHALLYILGLSLTNSMLGVMAAMSGRLLGTVLQNPLTIILIAAILTIFAFSMFGFWELRLPAVITGAASKSYAGYFGSLFIGLTLGLVAAPCIGPFVVGLLVMVAKSGNPWFGFLLFFCLSLGMGLPLFILALLSERLRHLPKSGEWMLWVRRFMGWILLGMAAFFLRTIVPETVGVILLGSVILAAAIHLGWLDASSAGFRAFG
ncbi:MAG: cytochrome c biogenesis protein CcdA, partial [Syntrophobacteraceae bacterium]